MKRKTDIIPGQEDIFEGDYFLHWEIAHLTVEVGRTLWGLYPRYETWVCYFPNGFSFPDNASEPSKLRSPGGHGHYHLVTRGIPSQKGQFGHKGICDREFRISEVIELRKKG